MEFKMKKTLLGTIVALTVSAVALPASAGIGTITINGKLTQSTCTVKVNGGTPDAVVTLPELPTSELATAGTTAGDTAFTMNLSNCTPVDGAVRAYFEHGPTVDAASGRLNNTNATGAGNVQVELLDAATNSLYVGNTSQRDNTATKLQSGAADLVYTARYYATGKSTAGELATSVTYSIDYE
jgi:major type 1 subunit fimbrin (pilin)